MNKCSNLLPVSVIKPDQMHLGKKIRAEIVIYSIFKILLLCLGMCMCMNACMRVCMSVYMGGWACACEYRHAHRTEASGPH